MAYPEKVHLLRAPWQLCLIEAQNAERANFAVQLFKAIPGFQKCQASHAIHCSRLKAEQAVRLHPVSNNRHDLTEVVIIVELERFI